MAAKAIGRTIKNPFIKTIDKAIRNPMVKNISNTIKNPIRMFHRRQNNIKNFVFVLGKRGGKYWNNIGTGSVSHLADPGIPQFELPKVVREGLKNFKLPKPVIDALRLAEAKGVHELQKYPAFYSKCRRFKENTKRSFYASPIRYFIAAEYIRRLLFAKNPRKRLDYKYRVINASKELYNLKGLEDGVDYKIYEVPLKRVKGHISVFEAGFRNKEVLVMVHGYGASSAFNFKQIPELAKKFHIYSIDLYGFGASYRPNIKYRDDYHAMEVYLSTIHETLEAINKKPYYIAAHSLGGYLITHYLDKYKPTKVKGVMLLSPAGVTRTDPNTLGDYFRRENFSYFQENYYSFINYLINERKWSPTKVPFISHKSWTRKFFRSPSLKLTGQEANLMGK